MIEARDLVFRYGRARRPASGPAPHPQLDDVSLRVTDGEKVGVVGPNGSGKTTLLRMLYGSLTPDRGQVLLDGRDLAGLPRRDIARELAVVVQERSSDLPMTVADLVMLGRLPYQGTPGHTRADDEAAVTRALATVGMDTLARRDFAVLSGGERQRALIARALAQGTGHILLDEPTNHLDIRYQHDVLDMVSRLRATVVVVLHDLNLTARYCDRVVVMDAGRIIADGAPADVLVPEVIAPVYGVDVRRVDVDGDVNLVFRPRR